ncbi:MAG: bacillithiol biosynthesis deacetylase BshB1, partial [Planctomycetes bacterium]|nr:bacillithiol biosynthesis deacetylase BshB1 [Planctomycetota bacterium]
MKLDCLVIAAHPDDAEISVGGTLLKLAQAGKRVGVVDVTRGELGTRGTVEDRARETATASELLGLSVRHNLDAGDGRVVVTPALRERLAAIIRDHAPNLVLCHHSEALHPAHAASGQLAREAWYLSGLGRLAEEAGGAPAHRPQRIYEFLGHVPFDPTFVVDIEPVWEQKVALIQAYASQLAPSDESDEG